MSTDHPSEQHQRSADLAIDHGIRELMKAVPDLSVVAGSLSTAQARIAALEAERDAETKRAKAWQDEAFSRLNTLHDTETKLLAELAKAREALLFAREQLDNHDLRQSLSVTEHLTLGNTKEAMQKIHEVCDSIDYALSFATPQPAAGRRLESVNDFQPLPVGPVKTIHAADYRSAQPDAGKAGEAEALRKALKTAEAALADIGDAEREPGDDLAWCERRAAEALPTVRAALAAVAGKGGEGR